MSIAIVFVELELNGELVISLRIQCMEEMNALTSMKQNRVILESAVSCLYYYSLLESYIS